MIGFMLVVSYSDTVDMALILLEKHKQYCQNQRKYPYSR